MLSYCLNCGVDTENANSKLSITSNGNIMLLLKNDVYNSKTLRFIKQETGGLLGYLEIRNPLSKIPLLGEILF